MPVAEFDWDGKKVTNLRQVAEQSTYGATHRDWLYTFRSGQATCTQSATATRKVSLSQFGTRIDVSMSSSNPLQTPAPTSIQP